MQRSFWIRSVTGRRSHLSFAMCLPLLAACSGGFASHASPPVLPAALDHADRADTVAAQTVSPALEVDGPQTTVPAHTTNDLLYVANVGTNAITVYHHDASGNTAPLYTIAGSKTRIETPGQLAQDAQGNLYVANGSDGQFSRFPAVLVFARGAHGNVAPIRIVAGSQTEIHNVMAMTVDQTTGKLFVVDKPGTDWSIPANVLRFPPNANGNVAPFARSGPVMPADQIASDSTGKNLIDAETAIAPNSNEDGVETYAKQFANNANLTALYGIAAFFAQGVADDPTTKTYLSTSGNGLYRFHENTDGGGKYTPNDFTPPPAAIVTSETCGGQLAIGYLNTIYVAHAASECSTDAVYVYRANANGNAAPLRVLSGSATQLHGPSGIYEGL